MGRVLVTEKLAQAGLDLMTAAGHQVDVQLGLSPEELVMGDLDVVEEDLTEPTPPGQVAQGADGDPGRPHVDQEVGDAPMPSC